MNSPSVFISYAAKSKDAEARALKEALEAAGVQAFRFVEGIESGAFFSPELADAILSSRVFVAFIDETYAERPRCRWELEAVMAAPDLTERLLVARPGGDEDAGALAHVPPGVADRNLPLATDTEKLVEMVQKLLKGGQPTLAHALGDAGAAELRARMISSNKMQAPERLGKLLRVPGHLPTSIGDAYVGREDITWRVDYEMRLRRGLISGLRPTVSLEGAGGAGKTRIAAEYTHRYGSHYKGGIFWLDGASSRDEQIHAVVRALEPETPSLDDLRAQGIDVGDLLKRTFESRTTGEAVLYVVDQVPETVLKESGLRVELEQWCPVLGEVCLLATSRRMMSLDHPERTAIRVPELGLDAAVSMLVRDVTAQISVADWETVAEWVGRMPLALVLLNAALRSGAINAASLVSLASKPGGTTFVLDAAMEAIRPHVSSGRVRGVTEAFLTSFESLDSDSQGLALVLAHLSEEPIPAALMEELGDPAAPRATLLTRSFLEPGPVGDVAIFGRMHPLLGDFLRTRVDSPRPILEQLLGAFLRLFDQKAIESPKSWPLLSALSPHALRVCDLVPGLDDSVGELADGARELLMRVAGYLEGRGDIAAAADIEERIFEARRRVKGANDLETAAAANNLANTLGHLGSYERAQTLQEDVAAIRESSLGSDDPATMSVYSNLATTLYRRGKLREARVVAEKVLSASERVLGQDHPLTLRAANNLGGIAGDQGDLVAARSLAERVVETRSRALAPDDVDLLSAEGNLAGVMFAQGEFHEAEKKQRLVLAGLTSVLPERHQGILNAQNNLANTLTALGRLDEARSLQELVLKERIGIHGRNHRDVLNATANLAGTLLALGEASQGLALQEEVLVGCDTWLGPEDRDTLRAIGNLAATLRASGETGRAVTLLTRLAESSARVLGPDHPESISSREALSALTSSPL